MSAREMATRRLADAARQALRTWRPLRDSDGDGVCGELTSALRDLDACDVDEPVGTTADTVTPSCDERQVIVDAFAAGADWMRERVINRLPGGWDAEEAAAGYVEGLGR